MAQHETPRPKDPRGIYPSDPRYKEIAKMSWDLFCWHNPAVFYDGTQGIEAGITDQPEYKATGRKIEDALEDALEDLEDHNLGPFKTYIDNI